jgi:hypothetical protein
MLLLVAALAVGLYAIREAVAPVRTKFWVHAMVAVHDRPMQPPLGNSHEPEGRREFHVRQVVSDEFLRAAVPSRAPAWVRQRIRVDAERPNQLWFHIETDSTQERAMLQDIVATYVRSHDATVFYAANTLPPPSYPDALLVATAAGGSSALVVALIAVRVARRRHPGLGGSLPAQSDVRTLVACC